MPATLGLLGAVVTLGLGVHEFRTLLRCKALIDAGQVEEAVTQMEAAHQLDREAVKLPDLAKLSEPCPDLFAPRRIRDVQTFNC